MPTVLQFRRGTTAQNNSFTGSAGELSIDTDLEVIRVHDGSIPGGYPLVGVSATQTLTNKTLSNVVISGTITANGGVGSSGQYLESTSTGVRWSTVDATQIFSGTSSVAVLSSGGNIRANVGGATIATIWSGGIDNGQANGVGNIGTSTSYFNTVFAKATSAQYADLAEKYTADSNYPAGTVVSFGGDAEITISRIDHDTSIAGVISTDPAFVMNTGLDDQYVAIVALQGRVPCRVRGIIAKGDRLVSSDVPGVAERLDMARYQPGCIIGKALEAHDSAGEGQIEVVVGRV